MSREHGGFIESTIDAANIPIIRNERDVYRAKHPLVDEEAEAASNEHDRRVSALLAQRDREQNLRDNRWAAFQIAIHNLPLTPEQITARVQQLFAPSMEPTPAEKSEEATTISASIAEESDRSMTLPNG
jgi:hypothetical protein